MSQFSAAMETIVFSSIAFAHFPLMYCVRNVGWVCFIIFTWYIININFS